mmetsp:Transcript_91132/g.195445  ORF Transcript_91132/g.195445 Transcript_91132/m.195445 type:complete len:343 (-) Transcript_91132:562-1590(-)
MQLSRACKQKAPSCAVSSTGGISAARPPSLLIPIAVALPSTAAGLLALPSSILPTVSSASTGAGAVLPTSRAPIAFGLATPLAPVVVADLTPSRNNILGDPPELLWHRLLRPFQHPDEFLGGVGLLGIVLKEHEGVASAVLAAPCPADSMHVILRPAHGVHDDVRDLGDVKAAADDICGHKHPTLAAPEAFEHPEPHLLLPTTVDALRLETLIVELGAQLVYLALFVHKDQHLALRILCQDPANMVLNPEHLLLLGLDPVAVVVDHHHLLDDALASLEELLRILALASSRRAADAYPDGCRLAEVPGQGLDLLGPRGGEEGRLPIGPYLATDRLHLTGEAHV